MNIRLKFILIALTCFSFYKAEAQQDLYQWGLEPYFGSFQFSPTVDLPNNINSYAYGLKINRRISSSFSLQLDFGSGYFDSQNNPSFGSADFLISYRLDNGKILKERAFMTPFLSAGVSYLNLSPDLEKVSYNEQDFNLKIESGLKFRFGDRINTILFISGGLPFKYLQSYSYNTQPIFKKIGISIRYNFGIRPSNFNAPSYYVGKSHEIFNPYNPTDYTTLVEVADTNSIEQKDSSTKKSTKKEVATIDTIPVTKELIAKNDKIKVIDSTSIINTGNDSLITNANDSLITNTVVETKDSIKTLNKSTLVNTNLKSTQSKVISDTSSTSFIEPSQTIESYDVDTISNDNIEEVTIVNSKNLSPADTIKKARVIEFKLDDNQLIIRAEKGEPIDIRIDRALINKPIDTSDVSRTSDNQAYEYQNDAVNKYTSTQPVTNTIVVPVSNNKDTNSAKGTDSTQQSSLNTPSTTPIAYPSSQSMNKINHDSLLMKLNEYETEIAALKKNQDDYFKIMESRLMAMELSLNSKRAIGDHEEVKQESTPQIIRDTIYKQTTEKAEMVTAKKQVSEEPIVLYFPLNTSTVQPNHIQALGEYLAKAKTDMKSIYLLSGYSDLVGDATYNLKLSKKRAESVKNYMIENGINEDRIIVRAFGEKRSTSTSIENDRRVEIERLIKQ